MGDINWGDKCWVTTIFLVGDDLRVLLSWNKNLQTWIPVGGHIDMGETPEDAIKREVKEELGVDFEFLNPSVHDIDSPIRIVKPFQFQIDDVKHHNQHMNFVFVGKCRSNGKEETDENEKLRWFSEEELRNKNTIMLENVRRTALEAIGCYKR